MFRLRSFTICGIALFLFLLTLPIGLVAQPQRTISIQCDAEMAQRSYAFAKTVQHGVIVAMQEVRCGEPPKTIHFLHGDIVTLVVRARYSRNDGTVWRAVCRTPMPDWYGNLTCNVEGKTVKALVN